MVRWEGIVSEATFRDCNNLAAANNGNGGNYGCLHQISTTLEFDLTSSPKTFTKGDVRLCEAFEGTPVVADRQYTYSWTDNFSDGQSGVFATNWFGDPDHGIAGAGLIKLEAFGSVTGTFEGELNPFTVERWADIDTIELRIAGVGKNKIVAECHYSVTGATLHSKPQ